MANEYRITQAPVETEAKRADGDTYPRVTQAPVEIEEKRPTADTAVRVTHPPVDINTRRTPTLTALRTTHVVVEMIFPYVCGQQPIPPTPPTEYRSIRRLRRAPHLSAEHAWIFYHEMQLDLEVGVGQSTGPTDPVVMLRWSDDKAHSWSNEHWVSAGKIGEYKRRAMWRQLGRSRDRTFEVVVDAAVQWALIDAHLGFTVGRR